MKKKILIFILGIILFPKNILAAGTAVGSVPSSVVNGNNVTFTVNLSNTAAWNIKMSGTGSTSGCYQNYADVTADGNNTSKSLSVTCKATSVGSITFSATGDITSADGTNSNVSITKTVSVTKPREKESEARLSSLSVDNYNINFNKDTYEYSINVDPDVSSINIKASAVSGYASISGTGNKEVSEDGNIFEVIVTAETGDRKVYKINVSVIDSNPINIEIDGEKYTVVKSSKLLKAPLNSTESNIRINDFKVPSYFNEKSNLMIVGIKNIDGKISYATYDNNNYKLYNENESKNLLLYIKEGNLENYEKINIIIDKTEYQGYKYNDRFVIVYAINLDDGKDNYYKYDTIDKTFQFFEIEENKEEINEEKSKGINLFIITTIIFAILFIGLGIYIIITNVKSSKKIKESIKQKK